MSNKSWLALVAVMAFITEAAAVSDNVMLKNMLTNEKGVVLLYMDGEYRNGAQTRYTLGCNQEPTKLPSAGKR